MKNLDFYNQMRSVPDSAKKPFSNGRFNGTDINPMWRIEKLTEVFGPCGIGWYFGKPEFTVDESNNIKTVHCTVALFVKVDGEWSQPCYGVGGNTICNAKGGVTDEAYKMAYTDAQSIAAKLLGLGADVWFAQSETKYTAKSTATAPPAKPAATCPADCKTETELIALWNTLTDQQKGDEKIKTAFAMRRRDIQNEQH